MRTVDTKMQSEYTTTLQNTNTATSQLPRKKQVGTPAEHVAVNLFAGQMNGRVCPF